VNVYVDSSVLLRIVFRRADALPTWRRIECPIASELIRLECLRTIDRARLQHGLSDAMVSERRAMVAEQLDAFHIIPLDRAVIEHATQPFPTLLGSLDAIHLATAILASAQIEQIRFATHDRELATARAVGFEVLGVSRPSKGRRRT
jgi:predicted nucleic acid-binding protein